MQWTQKWWRVWESGKKEHPIKSEAPSQESLIYLRKKIQYSWCCPDGAWTKQEWGWLVNQVATRVQERSIDLNYSQYKQREIRLIDGSALKDIECLKSSVILRIRFDQRLHSYHCLWSYSLETLGCARELLRVTGSWIFVVLGIRCVLSRLIFWIFFMRLRLSVFVVL